jgi:GNAT superfamily N-acetyltransferase
VDHYLDAGGLSVCPSTRGKGLGVMLLRARIQLCKGLRIPLTKTVFTAIQSQKISDKVGFQLVYEKNYEDFVQDGKLVFPDMAPTKTIQLKVHTIGK